jgi:hypothetical protein
MDGSLGLDGSLVNYVNGVTVDYKVAADSGVLETWLLIVKENTST